MKGGEPAQYIDWAKFFPGSSQGQGVSKSTGFVCFSRSNYRYRGQDHLWDQFSKVWKKPLTIPQFPLLLH